MKVSLPVFLLCALVISCGKKTHGIDRQPAPENAEERLTSGPTKRRATLVPAGQLIRHTLSIEGLVRDGLTELLKSPEIDETSHFIILKFTKGELCRGNGVNTGVWCTSEVTGERCSLFIVDDVFTGKRAIENVLKYEKLEQNLFSANFQQNTLPLGSATFYNFTAVDKDQPRISYVMCTSTAHEEFSLSDINESLGQELLTVPGL